MNTWILPASITIIFWGFAAVAPKLALQYINPISSLIYVASGYLIIALIALIFIGFRPDVHIKGTTFSVLTGVFYALGLLAFIFALKAGRVSIVSVYTALCPIIPILFGYFILKESLALKEVIGIVFAFAAIVLFSI